jgi:hypothetical protein
LGTARVIGGTEKMVPDKLETPQEPQYTFHKPSELDEAGIRMFAVLFAAYFMRAHGIKIPPQIVSAREEQERLFGQGPVPDMQGLPECLSSEEVGEIRLTNEERQLIEDWSALWDSQDERLRWSLVKKCAAEYLLENDYAVPRAIVPR